MTVRETLAQLERQCLGLDVPCAHGFEPLHCADSQWRGTEDVLYIQYEITGLGGGVWHLIIGLDDCELREGPSTESPLIVRASSEDWLAMWSGDAAPSALIESGRISVGCSTAASRDLSFLGVLDPLREFDVSERCPTTYPYAEDGEADRCVLRDAYPDALEREDFREDLLQSPRAFRHHLVETGQILLIVRRYSG